jgi:hypothetical protein
VQYLKDVSFREAVRELGGLKSPHVPVTPPARAKASSVIIPAADTRPLPTPAPDRTARAHWYLTEVRAIPASLVDRELESGRVFADTRGNVVFRLRDATGRDVGYEVRGTYAKPYHSVHGEKGMFVTKADPTPTAAFVESGIEALSYRALRGTGLIFSTTGSAVELPATMGRLLKDRGYEIVAAFNADKGGDRMAERLRELLGFSVRRDRPDSGKDWNEQLQAQRAHRSHAGAGPGAGAETEKVQAVTSTATGRVR